MFYCADGCQSPFLRKFGRCSLFGELSPFLMGLGTDASAHKEFARA